MVTKKETDYRVYLIQQAEMLERLAVVCADSAVAIRLHHMADEFRKVGHQTD